MATATTTLLKKWIRAASNLIALIPSRSIYHMLELNSQRLFRGSGKEIGKPRHVHYKTWNEVFSRCSRAVTAKKCIGKRDARADLLFCQSKPLCRSRCRRSRRCFSSLLNGPVWKKWPVKFFSRLQIHPLSYEGSLKFGANELKTICWFELPRLYKFH